MHKSKSIDELNQHKSAAIETVCSFIDQKIGGYKKSKGKADKFCYWLEDYIKFLNYESTFKTKCSDGKLKKYKRGEIVKAHLGFNIGSEEGGLHYCVIVEKNNAIKNPVVTVVPLTSLKPTVDINNLKRGSIFLGNELFTATSAKLSGQVKEMNKIVSDLKERLKSYPPNEQISTETENELRSALTASDCLYRTKKEFDRMKYGSIALVNQITTISKIRIYDPKTSSDPLAGIKLSNEKLDIIDNEIIRLYTK